MDEKIRNQLADYPVVIQLPVQWGDQDAFGHVNNTAHIRWFESARIAYLEQAGLADMISNKGVGPILASITCNYRRQLSYPDTVLVGARISQLGRSSMTMEHKIVSCRQQAAVADGHSVVVVFDYAAGRPRRVPDRVREAVERLENQRS